MTTSSNEWAWYARAAADARAALRFVRVEPGIEWSMDGPYLWLRGRTMTERTPAKLAHGNAILYVPVGDSGLVRAHPIGLRVPTATIPSTSWRPAGELVGVQPPPPAIAGEAPDPTPLGLARGGPPRAPAALRSTVECLARWADAAPGARLAPLEFAADASGEAFVVGAPLPPVAGTIYWQDERVFVPAGYRFDPDVDGRTARAVMTSAFGEAVDGDRFVVDRRGAARLAASAFVQVRRSALRATLAEVQTP